MISTVQTADSAGEMTTLITVITSRCTTPLFSFDGCANTCLDSPNQSPVTRRPSRPPSIQSSSSSPPQPQTTRRPRPPPSRATSGPRPRTTPRPQPRPVTTPRATPRPSPGPVITTYRPSFSAPTPGYSYPSPPPGDQLIIRPDNTLPLLYGPPI